MHIKKHILSLLCGLLLSSIAPAQNIPVYKIGDLMKRIHNTSDTVYVVNFWATWCKPCVAELPDFEKVHKEQKEKNVKVLLVSMDFSENISSKVIPFLQKTGYTAEVVLLDETNGNSFINQVSESWSGAIPATLITTHNRERHGFFEKKMTESLLLEAIHALQKP